MPKSAKFFLVGLPVLIAIFATACGGMLSGDSGDGDSANDRAPGASYNVPGAFSSGEYEGSVDRRIRGSTPIDQLKTGDCVNIGPAKHGSTINAIQVVSCGSEYYEFKVSKRLALTASTYPGSSNLLGGLRNMCGTGDGFVPSEKDWDQGFRHVVCLKRWSST